jgi:predicted nucleic acid-binding protein
MAATVYLETTIPSYLAARPSRDLVTSAHQQITIEWWQTRRTAFELYISQLVIDEAVLGDPETAERRLAYLAGIPSLEVTTSAQGLASSLLSSGLLPAKAAADALHIAIAAANGIDYLLTWNIRHLANATIRRGIEEACRRVGWASPVLCTPEELMEG